MQSELREKAIMTINNCIAGARDKEKSEQAAGTVLENNPVSRLLLPPIESLSFSREILDENPTTFSDLTDMKKKK